MKYLKLFSNDSEAENFEWSNEYLEPYCSYTTQTNGVRYNVFPHYIKCTYNVLDDSFDTVLLVKTNGDTLFWDTLKKVIVDGERIEFDIEGGYVGAQLSTGTHYAEFYFDNDTYSGGAMFTPRTTRIEFHGFKNIICANGNYGDYDCDTTNGSAAGNMTIFTSQLVNLEEVYFDESLEYCFRRAIYTPDSLSVDFTFDSELKDTDILTILTYIYGNSYGGTLGKNDTVFLRESVFNRFIEGIINQDPSQGDGWQWRYDSDHAQLCEGNNKVFIIGTEAYMNLCDEPVEDDRK